jgi:6,7-dimethyl-8-ribityllumazine synthase
LQGATIHAAQISNAVAASIADISVRTGVPITWGILTCDTQEEAIERAGMKLGNKGEEAALAAIEIASVKEQV